MVITHIEEYQKKIKEEKKQESDQSEGVTLSTLHSVKGLEYDKVYILDVNEGIMPYQKAVLIPLILMADMNYSILFTTIRSETLS